MQIASGGSHNCARDDTVQVWCWGSNAGGQLGEDTLTNRLTSVPVQGLNDAVDISVALSHSCAVRANGHVVCWGENSRGQLGANTLTDRRTPVQLRRIGNAVQVKVTWNHSCALRNQVRRWAPARYVLP